MKKIITLTILLFIGCQDEQIFKKEVIKNELTVIMESDNINDPIYIGKLKTFKNYSCRE